MPSTLSPRVHKHQALAYRPEIDGLRALAVLSVVFFHAHFYCPGGYVGVDVFFVISGFLITSLILRDLRADRFSLAEFWERRIRRILPAMMVMVLATLICGGFLLLSKDYEALGRSAIAQAFLVANLFFLRDDATRGGYFGPTSDQRPLLHTWSLAVEEQFYLLFPLVLVCLFRFERFRNPRTLGRLLLAGLLAGLVLAAHDLKNHPEATFYLLPTRAWELLCGAWIASLSSAGLPGNRWLREGASWLGIAGILLPCWLYTKQTPFPGLAALPPCLGTALLIWSNTRHQDGQSGTTAAGRLLALRPIVFIGMISYSLYLWHWPVLVLGKYWYLHSSTPWYLSAGLVLLAGLLAVLSWRFVETPFRRKILMATRASAFRFAAVSASITLLIGTALTVLRGLPARLPELALKNEEAEQDRAGTREMSLSIKSIRQGRLFPFGCRESAVTPKLLLWGDSHAKHAIPALDALCREWGIAGCAATRSANPPLLDYGLKDITAEFSAAVLEQIKRKGISNVILAAYWSSYQSKDPQILETTLSATIRKLHEAGCKVWVLQDVPDFDVEPFKVLARNAIFGMDDPISWRRQVSEHHRKNAILYQMAEQGLPATFLDPAPRLLDPQSNSYRADIQGISLYHDVGHLTSKGSLALLLPMFREALAGQLGSVGQAGEHPSLAPTELPKPMP
ncbi:MAG: acyltransferase family protein [Verrucomicrobia bacterium]|nr:acyltransferase family protein [Verrucomicrobiota bacterium]